MERITTGRPIAAVISLTAAGVIALTATTSPPAELHLPGLQAPHISTQAIHLTAAPLDDIWNIATGRDGGYPLPAGTNPVAPIAELAVRSLITYGGQLLTGKADLIPGEISTQIRNLTDALSEAGNLLTYAAVVGPLAIGAATFLTAAVIASLPASGSALAGLPGIWLNAVLTGPLRFVYTVFAIRNTIAVAAQAPSAQPAPAGSTPAGVSDPATAGVALEPIGTATSSRTRGSARGVAGSATPNRKAAPAAGQNSARPAAATDVDAPRDHGRPEHKRATGSSARTGAVRIKA